MTRTSCREHVQESAHYWTTGSHALRAGILVACATRCGPRGANNDPPFDGRQQDRIFRSPMHTSLSEDHYLRVMDDCILFTSVDLCSSAAFCARGARHLLHRHVRSGSGFFVNTLAIDASGRGENPSPQRQASHRDFVVSLEGENMWIAEVIG